MDLEHYKTFKTLKERAAYLLKQQFAVRIQIQNLTPVSQVFIGEIGLPITGTDESDEVLINKAKAWLQEKAEGEE